MIVLNTAKEVITALRTHYDKYEYAFLEQVSNGIGRSTIRHADALAMSLWRSRGFELIGFEVKVSRSDWLNELKKPDKADIIASYCHTWYLIAGNQDIVKTGELPLGWGLMVPRTKTSLKTIIQPTKNQSPKPIDYAFLGAILKSTSNQLTQESELLAKYQEGYIAGIEHTKKDNELQHKYDTERIQELKKKIDDFEKASGIDIRYHFNANSQQIGEAVKMVLNGDYLSELRRLEGLRNTAKHCLESIDEILDKHRKEQEVKT